MAVRVPAFLLSKVPVAVVVKVSPFSNPLNVPTVMLAVVVPSYSLLAALLPLMASPFLLIVALCVVSAKL